MNPGKRRRKALRQAAGLLVALALAAAAGLCVRYFGAGTVRIAGTSMNDTLSGGDIALVVRCAYRQSAPRRGDVVECRFPGRADTYVKRVIGLPGETLAFSGGALTVDGAAVAEPYVSTPTEDCEVTLGEDEYFVLGDNREASYDSRMEDMGPIGLDGFVGRVVFVLWPPERMGAVD